MLLMFILMAIAYLTLYRKLIKYERVVGTSMQRERRNMIVILIFFELGYLVRFIFSSFLIAELNSYERYSDFIKYYIIYIFDGSSLLPLLLAH